MKCRSPRKLRSAAGAPVQSGQSRRDGIGTRPTAAASGSGLAAMIAWTLVLLAAAIAASGCAGPRRSSPRTSALSDAAAQSMRDEEQRRRPLVVRDGDGEASTPRVTGSVSRDDGAKDVLRHRSRTGIRRHGRARRREPGARFFFGVTAFGGGSDRDDGVEWSGGGLRLGADVDRRWRGEVELSYRELRPEDGRSFPALLDQEEWHVGANLRSYLAAPRYSPRVYTLLGASLGVLNWDYRSPVEVVSVDDWGHVTGYARVHSDRLLTGAAYIGGGVALVNTPSFELGVNGRLGYQFYDEETQTGLFNDLLDHHPFGAVALEVTLFPEARSSRPRD